jgi:hypothetical protein
MIFWYVAEVFSELSAYFCFVYLFVYYYCYFTISGGTWWRSWLRHCATSRKVAGSIPDGVTGNFQLLNPSGRIVTLGSTQPVAEMSNRIPSRG